MAMFWNKKSKSKSSLNPASQRAPEKTESVRSNPSPAAQHKNQALSQVKNIIAVASGKGGVGKSTVTTNLAVALRYLGASVGVLDADIYGPSQPGMLGQNTTTARTTPEGQLLPIESHGVRYVSMGLLMNDATPVVWRAPMAMKMIQNFLNQVQWGALDFLLIDLPPGTGDVQLTIAQSAPLAGAVIVTTPQQAALGIARKGLEMFKNLNIPIAGIVENMSGFTCKECGHETAIFKEGGGQDMSVALELPFLGSIPLDPAIMQSGEIGQPLMEKDPDSIGARAFLSVAQALVNELKSINEKANQVEPEKFELRPDGSLILRWPDGHAGVHRAFTLRAYCGCASCIDENSGRRILDLGKIKTDIRLTGADVVGRYAINLKFSDGHTTGIYPFAKLRPLCECTQCAPAVSKQPPGQPHPGA